MWDKVIFVPVATLIGLVMGSFYNVLIYRLPRKISIVNPTRSFCPSCGHQLAWKDNVPVVSYLFLKGKCRYCGEKISARYPLVESVTAGLFVLAVCVVNDPIKILALWAMYSAAMIVTFIDFEYMLIPDSAVVTTATAGLLWSWRGGHLLLSVETASGAFLFFLLLYLFSRGGMGFGDVEYFGALALFLTPFSTILAVLIASLAALAYSIPLIVSHKVNGKSRVPFGPFLAIGTSIAMFLNFNFFKGW